MGIRIVAIQGSVRPGNYTAKTLALVADELSKTSDIEFEVLRPGAESLPLPGLPATHGAQELRDRVASATGVILATPEYHGSFSSVIKLTIENLGFPSVLAGKPVALLGVAAGAIGAIKSLEHLRSVCSHVGAIVLPGPVSVARVQKVFDADGRCLDPAAEKMIRALPSKLIDYVKSNLCPRLALEEIVRREGS
jgi:NAD(P)H-dependent FMN reductase